MKIETSTGNFWTESYGQIYPILKRLVAEGMATQSIEPQVGKPSRHVYMLTDKGLKDKLYVTQALISWCNETLAKLYQMVEET